MCPKGNLGWEIQRTNVGIRISILKIPCVPILRQNEQLWLFAPKFDQKWILRSEFQKSKSGFGISTSTIPCVPIFSQNEQLWTFRPKFGEIALLRAIFWFEFCWRRCRAERRLKWAGWRLKWAVWRWMELGGAGWSWVHGLVIPVGKH